MPSSQAGGATIEYEKNTKDEEGEVLSIDAIPTFDLCDSYGIPNCKALRF